ncbi:MAG: hypothetical protein IT562_02910 [Alphaproteobacteria bacterium]|nr:hypothetical protein [Alphaproteobacteria bacterium]
MTSCRADRPVLGLAALLLAAVAGCGPAWGQGRPVPLTPSARPGPSPTVAPLAPLPGAGQPVSGQPVSTETAKPGEASVQPVASDPLRAIDSESLGLLSEPAGGFGVTLWGNTRRDIVELLLARIPAAVASPTQQSLAHRLLLSIASPPEGERVGPGLMPLRIERLYARGEFTSALELISALPARDIDPRIALVRVNVLLLTDDVAGACQEGRKRLTGGQQASAGAVPPAGAAGAFWDKLAVFCDLIDKDKERAQFDLALVRDQGDKDAAFFALVDALSGNAKAALRSFKEATPLTLAMARAANQQLPADTGPLDQPALLRGIALSPVAPAAMRLEAAHRAALYGALPPEDLAKAYAAAEIPPAQLANAFSEAAKQGGVRARTLLYRAAQAQTQPQGRAEALKALYALGRQEGDFALLARVSLPLLLEMRPAREQAWFAGDAGRALSSARRLAEAKAWYDAAGAAPASDRDAGQSLLALWARARLADGDAGAPWSGERFRQWRAAVEAGKPETVAPRLAMALMLFDAFGEPVIGVDWAALYKAPMSTNAPVPSPLLWFGLREASGEGRVGETVLHALVALGDAELGRQSPVVVAYVIGSLKALGLEREARALAVDAAIAAGL